MSECHDRWDVSQLPHPDSAIMQAMRRMWADADAADRPRIEAQVAHLKDATRGPYLDRIEAVWRWVADEYPPGWAALAREFPEVVARRRGEATCTAQG